MSRPYISVVAPCYNEVESIDAFHRRARAACEATGRSFEIVLVNDGSKDGTWDRMVQLGRDDPNLVAVNLSRNHGHQLALTAGLSVCRGERVLIIDADLQDPPELLADMMKIMDDGADIVYGQRRQRAGEGMFKLATAALFYRIIEKLTDVPIPRDTGDFRLISRRALDVLQSMPERHRFIRGMVSWIGFRQEALKYDRQARFAGETKYPFRKMFKFAIDAITAFSVKPLQWASILGIVMAGFAAILVIYSIVSWLLFSTVSGWTSLMAAVALVGGTQLFVLGLIGEYLGRLYDQSKGRPLFIIQDVVRGDASGGNVVGGAQQSQRDAEMDTQSTASKTLTESLVHDNR